MNSNHSANERFLAELYQATHGKTETNVSMYEIGAALGLDRTQSGRLAEEVIAEGWAEIKTLSGGIGITAEGIQAAGIHESGTPGKPAPSLSPGPVINDEDRAAIAQALEWIKEGISGPAGGYRTLEQLVVDLKTAEIQLLSPQPKTAILKAIFVSLQKELDIVGEKKTAARIDRLVRS